MPSPWATTCFTRRAGTWTTSSTAPSGPSTTSATRRTPVMVCAGFIVSLFCCNMPPAVNLGGRAVCFSRGLSVYVFVSLSACLPRCRFPVGDVCLSLSVCLSASLSSWFPVGDVCLSLCLFACLTRCLAGFLSATSQSVSLLARFFFYLLICPSLSVCVLSCPSVCLPV